MAREDIRKGVQVTNITFSGGVFNQLDNLDNRQFGDEELAVMEEAERVGRFVAARVHSKKGIVAALKAGCKTVEHETRLYKKAVELIKEERHEVNRDYFSGALYQDERRAEAHEKMYKLAVKACVKITVDTDLGMSRLNNPLPHSNDGKSYRG